MDILLRFRVHKVALSADIEKAFLMVSVAEEDRDVLRFLWVEDIHSHIPKVKTMRFSRVVFGVTSSPFLLNATVNHHMEKYRGSDPIFVDKLLRSIYVDDVVFGAESNESAYELYQNSKIRFLEGGFTLRKFVTKSHELQE